MNIGDWLKWIDGNIYEIMSITPNGDMTLKVIRSRFNTWVGRSVPACIENAKNSSHLMTEEEKFLMSLEQ